MSVAGVACPVELLSPLCRFDRYQEADVSEYGRSGAGQYDIYFKEF